MEIDPELEEVGGATSTWASNPNLTVHNEDARPWLRRSAGDYDVIMVDAYRQPYIPFYLATREFFELVRDRLAPGGVVIVNVGHPEGNDDLETGARTDDVRGLPDRAARPDRDTNTLLVASEAPASAGRLRAAVAAPAGGPLRRWPGARRPGSGRAFPAAASTPTIARRWSG